MKEGVKLEEIEIQIVYDNEIHPSCKKTNIGKGWGFSSLVKTGETFILFDCGWNGNMLISNLKKLAIDIKKISKVVVSHDHWDHLGGLTAILPFNKDVEVFVPQSFSRHLKEEIASMAKVYEVSQSQQIFKNIYTTGEMGKTTKEQSLIIRTMNGVVVLTGCAHPGLDKILERSKTFGSVYGIIGGFHGFREFDLLKEISLIVPCHCTQYKKEILNIFKEKCKIGGTGFKISFSNEHYQKILELFEKNWKSYDDWYDENKAVYLSEINIFKPLIPQGYGLEIGVGPGRFAQPLGVQVGIDPSFSMLKIAKSRGIETFKGFGEFLPFKEESFDFVLMATTLCFAEEPQKIIEEAKRVLKSKGEIIIGIINRESKWGRYYESIREKSEFFKLANFYSPQEVIKLIEDTGFKYLTAYQTLLKGPWEFSEIEEPKEGFNEGSFVVIVGMKPEIKRR